ncbi:MAG TPA: enoyl-CoA hydratase [Steroidobacteraceae bacterium]
MSSHEESRSVADVGVGGTPDRPLRIERDGRVLILTLHRPDKLNALTPELHEQLHQAVVAASNDADIGAIVLTGAGRAFCSGGDMGGRKDSASAAPTLEQRAEELRRHGETARLLHDMPKPTLAMVNGVAAGAGLALALACDLRIASRDSVLTTSYVKVAMSGDLGCSYFLTQLVGSAKARELMFLSERIDATEASRIGLVSRIVDADSLRAATLQLAQQLAQGPALALRYIKRNLTCAETGSLAEVLETEAFGMGRCGRTQDAKEAALAFREKRPPIFKGC